jgi:DNA-binding FadR family transcriptional regulator
MPGHAAAPGDRPTFVGKAPYRPKTAEILAQQIRRQIVRKELPTGSLLPPESILMRQFGVSRATLREALRILESEALITVRRGARDGAEVTGPDPSVAARHVGMLLQIKDVTIEDVYRARMVLEPACAGLLAARRSPDDVTALREALAGELRSEDLDDLTEAGSDFHETLVELASDGTLGTLALTLVGIAHAHGAAVGDVERGRPLERQATLKVMHDAHERLVDLIAAGDQHAAERFWRRHMDAASAVVLSGLGPESVNIFS